MKNKSATPKPKTTTVAVSPAADKIFSQLAKWLPDATFGLPKRTTEDTSYGKFSGESLAGFTMAPTASMPHFEDADYLKKLGFTPDNMLSADGPGSSVWGYSKEQSGKRQIILFSSEAKPLEVKPNEPLQFNCPCNTNVRIFVSE